MKHKAFTLLELLIVLVILGFVVAIALPGLSRARDDSETESMRGRALTLQSAKQMYQQSTSTASANWAGAADDQARYALLLGSNSLPNTGEFPANLTSYIPSPYVAAMGATIYDDITLTKSGTTVKLYKR